MRLPDWSVVSRRGLVRLAVLLLGIVACVAHAQSAPQDSAADPPDRVARLSLVDGDLGLLPAGATDWSDATLNRPLTTGDRLSSGNGSRAELELGGAALRLAGQTDVGLLTLDDQLAQVELTQGTLNVSVRQLDEGQSYEIDTPSVALVIDQPGIFRVDINPDGQATQITAFDGNATIYGENNVQRPIQAGRSYRVGDASLGMVTISAIDGGDAFDAWCSGRDRRYASASSGAWVPADVVGAQDLDQYGDWASDSDYGAIWYPADAGADWAPYRDGSWSYIEPWGWTWIDDARWGFAPYHYGRWAHTRRGWGWIPGPRGVRPVYAPALVAFAGGVSRGGPVGWFPLAPGEIYNPWYAASRRYYGSINRSNLREFRGYDRGALARDIDLHYDRYRSGAPMADQHYANRAAPHGFTAVPAQDFASGRGVQHARLAADPRQFAGATVMPRGIGIRPVAGRGSRSFGRTLPVAGFDRQVVARHAPAASLAAMSGARSQRDGMARRPPAAQVHVLGTRSVDRGGIRVEDDRAASPQPSSIGERGMPPAGELRSARFAHPQSNGGSREPRPGVSYISRDDGNVPRDVRRSPQTLPQVPRIERAAPVESAPRDDRYRARFASPRDEQPREFAPANTEVRPSPPRPGYGMPSRPIPEPMRPVYQPREQPARIAPAYAPQARPAANRAPPPRPEPRERPARHNDKQQ